MTWKLLCQRAGTTYHPQRLHPALWLRLVKMLSAAARMPITSCTTLSNMTRQLIHPVESALKVTNANCALKTGSEEMLDSTASPVEKTTACAINVTIEIASVSISRGSKEPQGTRAKNELTLKFLCLSVVINNLFLDYLHHLLLYYLIESGYYFSLYFASDSNNHKKRSRRPFTMRQSAACPGECALTLCLYNYTLDHTTSNSKKC